VGHLSEAFVGIDTSKLRNAVAIAEGGRGGEVRYLGEFPATEAAMRKLVAKLAAKYRRLTFCYKAGPTGYGLYRLIKSLGHECLVAAPSLIPKKPGERVKTKRILVEAAWAYRHPPRVGREKQAKVAAAPKSVREIAWKAQVRLCGRYRSLSRKGKHPAIVVTAIARELSAFIWAINREVMARR